jgi:hypothetical protein
MAFLQIWPSPVMNFFKSRIALERSYTAISAFG